MAVDDSSINLEVDLQTLRLSRYAQSLINQHSWTEIEACAMLSKLAQRLVIITDTMLKARKDEDQHSGS